jgi:hypothetical protein
LIVLYISDFDPSGRQMPVSAARKIQALRDLQYPDLDAEVHHVGMTLEQVERFNLPSTPLKETEKRANKWREIMGREQSEVDAMLSLHPGELTRIVRRAIAPFYDRQLERRAQS